MARLPQPGTPTLDQNLTQALSSPLQDNGAAPVAGPIPPPDSVVTLDPNSNPPEQRLSPRQLHPLPKGLIELYGLLAVLFVLVPEWMAGGALVGFKEGRDGSQLPVTASAWRRVPELRLAAMGLAELRLLAKALRIQGYASLRRDRLTVQVLKRLQWLQNLPAWLRRG